MTNTMGRKGMYRGEADYIYGREARLQRIRRRRRREAQRRRMILIAAVLLMTAALGMSLTGFSRISSRRVSPYKYYKAVTVCSEDTLWGIAQEHMTEEYSSIRSYIKEIREINNMKNDDIYYGQKLIVPYYSSSLK